MPLQNEPDDLQKVWRGDDRTPTAVGHLMMLELVQGKRRSLQDFRTSFGEKT